MNLLSKDVTTLQCVFRYLSMEANVEGRSLLGGQAATGVYGGSAAKSKQ